MKNNSIIYSLELPVIVSVGSEIVNSAFLLIPN